MSDPMNSLPIPEENNEQQPQTKGKEPQNESPETVEKRRSHIKRFPAKWSQPKSRRMRWPKRARH